MAGAGRKGGARKRKAPTRRTQAIASCVDQEPCRIGSITALVFPNNRANQVKKSKHAPKPVQSKQLEDEIASRLGKKRIHADCEGSIPDIEKENEVEGGTHFDSEATQDPNEVLSPLPMTTNIVDVEATADPNNVNTFADMSGFGEETSLEQRMDHGTYVLETEGYGLDVSVLEPTIDENGIGVLHKPTEEVNDDFDNLELDFEGLEGLKKHRKRPQLHPEFKDHGYSLLQVGTWSQPPSESFSKLLMAKPGVPAYNMKFENYLRDSVCDDLTADRRPPTIDR